MVYRWSKITPMLWPGACLLCGGRDIGGSDLCTNCRDALPRNSQACAACASPLPLRSGTHVLCGQCQHHPPSFASAVVPYLYADPLAFLVSELKFRRRLSAGRVLGELLAEAVAGAARPEALVPVPLHPQRLAERGFNQATELARHVARRLAIPLELARLRRQRDTPPQHGLERRARLGNLKGAFQWKGGTTRFTHLAVIDDVMTTGATAEAVARELRQGGVGRIDIWAVARTPPGGG